MKQDYILPLLALIFVLGAACLIQPYVGGWSNLGQMALGFGLIKLAAALSLAPIAIIVYYFTKWRCYVYVHCLKVAGCEVAVDNKTIRDFVRSATFGFVITLAAVWVTYRLVTHPGPAWVIIIVNGLIWLVGLTQVLVALLTWWVSFRPLRLRYKQLQLEQATGTPK